MGTEREFSELNNLYRCFCLIVLALHCAHVSSEESVSMNMQTLLNAEKIINSQPRKIHSIVQRVIDDPASTDDEKAYAYNLLVQSYLSLGLVNDSLQQVEKGLQYATTNEQTELRLKILKSDALYQQGFYGRALKIYQQVSRTKTENHEIKAFAFQGIALCLASLNEFEDAVKALTKASSYIEYFKDPQDRASVESAIARVYYKMGNLERAIEYARTTINTISQFDNPIQLNPAWYNLGEALYENNQKVEAAKAFNKAMEYAIRAADDVGIAYAKWGLARVSVLKSIDSDAELIALKDAQNEFDRVGDTVMSIKVRINIAERFVENKQGLMAIQELRDVKAMLASKEGLEYYSADVERVIAKAYYQLEQYQLAYDTLEKYINLYRKEKETESKKQVDAFRVRLQTTLKEQENEMLIKENQLHSIETNNQKRIARVFKLSSIIAALIIIIVVLLLIKNRRMQRRLKLISITDELTLLNNRRYINEQLKIEFARMLRYETALTIGLIDVDHFKSINDTFGHDAGDEVLVEIAKILTGNSRVTDICGRWGGEEFIFVMPDTMIDDAHIICERIRLKISKLEIAIITDRELSVSIGISQCKANDLDYKACITRADKALYNAKDSGRGRVCQLE